VREVHPALIELTSASFKEVRWGLGVGWGGGSWCIVVRLSSSVDDPEDILRCSLPVCAQMASMLHMVVFSLLAQREGKPKPEARAKGDVHDAAGAAHAAKAAQLDAKSEALGALPDGWSVITDAATGQTAYWNQFTKVTVFSRPVE
jgi:hypothetical protein